MNGGEEKMRLSGSKAIVRMVLFMAAWSMMLSHAQVVDEQRWLHRLLATTADAVAAERSLGLDPALKRRIVAEGDTMMSIYCGTPEMAVKCKRVLSATLVQTEVGRYIAQLQAASPQVRLIAANLAKAVGHDLAEAGWPSDIANDVGIIMLSDGAKRGSVLLSSASGQTEMARSASALLMLPGTYHITVVQESKASKSGVADVKARVRTTLVLIGAGLEATTFGRLDPPDVSFCFDTGTIRFEGPVGMFNWGRATFVEPAATKLAYLAPTATASAVSLQLEDQAKVCRGLCPRSVGVAFAEAIATWKAGCERCDQNAMSVLSVDGTTWVDARIASRLRTGFTKVPLDLRQPVAGEIARLVPPSIVPTRTAIYGFEQVSGDEALSGAACKLSPDASAPWLPALKASVCGGSWVGVARITSALKLLAGGTSCGPARDFLACGLPNNGIEISVELDRFELRGIQPAVQFGVKSSVPSIDLRAVILHEVGHWFGVPHFELTRLEGADIMAETYGGGKACVSGVSLMMLNNASDIRWSYRVIEGKGLRRPRQTRSVSPNR